MSPLITLHCIASSRTGPYGSPLVRSPYEALEMSEGHHGPGQRTQAHAQHVDAQQGADGHHADHQPPMERHPRQGASARRCQAACACPALRNMRRQKTEAEGKEEDAVPARDTFVLVSQARGK